MGKDKWKLPEEEKGVLSKERKPEILEGPDV